MRKSFDGVVESGRITNGPFRSVAGSQFGAFFLECPETRERLKIIVGDAASYAEEGLPGEPFDHVSVSCERRCPMWVEMCWVKDMFFEPDECVMQLHPPKIDYVNKHEYVLHLWKPSRSVIPMPPKVCV